MFIKSRGDCGRQRPFCPKRSTRRSGALHVKMNDSAIEYQDSSLENDDFWATRWVLDEALIEALYRGGAILLLNRMNFVLKMMDFLLTMMNFGRHQSWRLWLFRSSWLRQEFRQAFADFNCVKGISSASWCNFPSIFTVLRLFCDCFATNLAVYSQAAPPYSSAQAKTSDFCDRGIEY